MMSEIASGAIIAAEIALVAKREGWLDRLLGALRHKHRVLVFGNSGAGKTQLIDSLTQTVPTVIDAMTRTEFVTAHRLRIEREPFVFLDTPGQEQHVTQRREAIRESIKTPTAGVLNVVSYGYDEGRLSIEDAIIDERISTEYLAARRERELAAIDEWAPLLIADSPETWLITVVTKADLWWDAHRQVINHYTKGPYDARLRARANNRVGAVVEYCSVYRAFHGVVPPSPSFSQADRELLRSHLLRTMVSAIK